MSSHVHHEFVHKHIIMFELDSFNNCAYTLQKNRPVPAFLQTAVIGKPIPALFVGALQSATIGGL